MEREALPGTPGDMAWKLALNPDFTLYIVNYYLFVFDDAKRSTNFHITLVKITLSSMFSNVTPKIPLSTISTWLLCVTKHRRYQSNFKKRLPAPGPAPDGKPLLNHFSQKRYPIGWKSFCGFSTSSRSLHSFLPSWLTFVCFPVTLIFYELLRENGPSLSYFPHKALTTKHEIPPLFHLNNFWNSTSHNTQMTHRIYIQSQEEVTIALDWTSDWPDGKPLLN